MSKARVLADFISDGSTFADGAISVAEVSGAAPLASPTFTGNVDLGDNVRIRLGDSDDLQIYHDGQNSYIDDTATGFLHLRGDSRVKIGSVISGETMASFIADGEVQLFHNNVQKFATKSTGVEVTGKTTTDELDLNAIAATIADTAVDIFVYDTRKDSDGGAWRKRTQHTSWYNETLNTATRGSRKEFPAVAVIVAETNQVTIYDGDDPDLPMWMVFNAGSSYAIKQSPISTISIINGLLSVGASAAYGINRVDFIQDKSNQIFSSDRQRDFLGSIADRNAAKDYESVRSAGGGLINDTVNDVAMTVLPNAPIDAATGLPVPTIAIATNGGVSVIKDDGTVISTISDTGYKVHNIDLQSNGNLFAVLSNSSNANYAVTWAENYTGISGLSWSTYTNWNSIGGFYYASVYGSNLTYIGGNTGGTINDLSANAIGSFYGLTKTDKNPSDFDAGLVNFISSNYNTGWMNGDIKLATLSDTDATNVTGSELVTNGTFDTDVSGWSAVDGTIAYSSGQALVTRTGGSGNVAYQDITTVVGSVYVLSGTTISTGTGDKVDLRAFDGSTMLANAAGIDNQTVQSSATFTATSTTTRIWAVLDNSGTATIDNVSVRLAEEDRSVNGNGLQVFGTVTKSAVATGADLVGYSGFSASNFLAQPLNPDFDIGTGTICLMTWVKYAGSGNQNIVTFWDTPDYGTFTSASYGHYIQLTSPADGKFNFAIGQSSPASATALTTTTTYNDSQWHMVVGVRDNGVMKIYVDGQLQLSGSNTLDIDTSGTGFLIFGKFYGTIGGWGGDIALTRISTTAPSPEQILKIYNDEKHLFTEGAQATLYGSSDAVTALAYDDSTNLLHVGTSAGRSVFQGLRRVDNTTTAVGAAISASNGLVADE